MATRKSRQNTESPTPSGTESVPTTPTTPATRNTRSIRNKQLQQGRNEDTSIQIKTEKLDEEEAVKETSNDEEVSAATATITQNITNEKPETKESADQNDKEKEISPPAVSTRKRRIAAAKDEMNSEKLASSNESASTNTPDDGKTSPTKMKRSRRSAFELLTDSKSTESSPSILSKRRNSTGKIEKPTRKMSSRIKNLKKLRKTPLGRALLKKPERITVAVNKPIKQLIEKQTIRSAKVEKSDSASDSELIKLSRRRSDSVSKCSDMTDASSFHEAKGSTEDLLTQSSSETSEGKVIVKEEMAEKVETSENKPPENEITEVARNANDSGLGGDSDNSQIIKTEGDQSNDSKRSSRFSRRKKPLNFPRVMNTRSRSETPSKVTNENQGEYEGETTPAKEVQNETSDSVTEIPLHIDTTVSDSNAYEKLSPEIVQADKKNATDEKAKSLSPVLVSEGVSEISVKQFYGRADFLENNLGIEKDPKLGEIVQIQEKIKAKNIENDEEASERKPEEDCVEKPKDFVLPSVSVVLEIDTSTEESMKVRKNSDENKIDGAKCAVETDVKNSKECFVKPTETIRRDSTTILNENLLVLNGEIELMSKKEKKEVVKNIEDVGEVVLYKITNGMRVNPEKLEKVLESQKLKEKERSDSIESVENEVKSGIESKIVDKKLTESVDDSMKAAAAKDENKTRSVNRTNSMEIKATNADNSDTNKDSLIKPAAVRSNSSSKNSRSSSLDDESPEERIQKESHLKTLGLLTHQAAEEATIEKQKQREKIKASKGKKHSEYTGTLKTVIKLHRGNDKKKGNQSLKMTLHKGRAKNGSDKSDSHSTANSEEDTYYTIQQQDIDGIDHEADEAAAKEHEKLLVIPEKASSFRYHPEKICEDQCFYCGGKFGLFDTPCHIAQIKSTERQKKILEFEEKLTVDSCLCDACFRHVDRRANCPSYKKRLSEPAKTNESNATAGGDDSKDKDSEALLFQNCKEVIFCQVHDCKEQASHSLCRKWALKMRKSLNKYIQLNCDHTNTMSFLPICDKHYEAINHLMICVLCNRRLKRNHCYFFSQDANKVESLIANEGIQLTVGTTSVACKLCRYYVNLLMRPQEAKKVEFVREYKKRLLDYHGKVDLVEEDSEDSVNHEPTSKRSKRNRRTLNDHSDCGLSKSSKSNDVSMIDQDSINNTLARTRQKNKQLTQHQLLEEQQRVEKRVQHEQMKLKQQEMLQHQKVQDELRQHQLRSSSEDISNLRTNPNISMRELFPGEEEMGLHVNLPFANSWRTPDGWTKVTSTVQYDEPTKKLWEELEKPYGNQSSFLRHLLLLEKYFRNGDLLLAQNANHNAITYAESVQHRLQAFDNIPTRAVSITQIQTHNTTTTHTIAADLVNAKSVTTANKAVTISKVNPQSKQPVLSIATNPKPNTSDNVSNSLLKSNVAQFPKTRSYTVTTEPINGEKTDSTKLNSLANSNIGTPKNKNPGLPPELICITTPSIDKHVANAVPPPSYQLQMQLTLQQQIQQQHQNSLLLSQQTKQLLMVPPNMIPTNQISSPKKQTANNTSNSINSNKSPNHNKGNVIRLPDTLTEAERRESKNWRPTLIAITPENKNSTDGQLYQTVDGRKLPHLVQVLSKGKPYMISIHDYNRMCILHREKLLKEQQSELLKNKNSASINSIHTASPASQRSITTAAAAAASTAVMNSHASNTNPKTVIDVDKLIRPPPPPPNNSSNGQSTSKAQIPNKFLEQNSLTPIGSSKSNESSTSTDSLLRFRFPIKNKSSLLKSSVVPTSQSKSVTSQQSNPSNTNVTATVVAPLNPLPKQPSPQTNALSQPAVVSITSTPSISALTSAILGMTTPASTPPPPIQIIPNQLPPITITNVTSGNSNNSASQSNVSSLEALFRTTNQVTTTPTTMFQWAEHLNKSNSITPIDNSASSILSKIPKSLTVIPQQKYHSKGGNE